MMIDAKATAHETVPPPKSSMKGLIGRKLGMTQLFTEKGEMVPVTVLEVGPCFVTQVKSTATDGYNAVQLGFDEVKQKKLTGGERGHLKQAKTPMLRELHEFGVKDEEVAEYSIGQRLLADVFAVGDFVDVAGTSKGKGFAGGIKRHNFNRQPKTHGASDRTRAPGASSSGTTPGHTFKGRRLPGHMGNAGVTVQNLRVVTVDAQRNLLAVKGAVPGPKNGVVIISSARKKGGR